MALTAYFGATPRVRILEAIVRLAPFESFTMKEVAQEAGLFPPTTYRTIRGLVQEGFLEMVESGRPESFRVPRGSPNIQLLALIEAATTQVRNPIQLRRAEPVVAQFKKLSAAVARSEIATNSLAGPRVDVSKGVVRRTSNSSAV